MAEDFTWSDETYSIKDVARNESLPIVVRVSEGYLSSNDSETFSQGDLIRLDFKRTYKKIAARCLQDGKSSAQYMNVTGEFLIPLGYHGKLTIVHQKVVYNHARELINASHMYVKVESDTHAYSEPDGTRLTIPKGTVLAATGKQQRNGVVFMYKDDKIVLKSTQPVHLTSVPDESQYTLSDIVDKFEFPIVVEFLDSDFPKLGIEGVDSVIDNIRTYKGKLKLLRLVEQEVIVGHYKPPVETETSSSERFFRRHIALLPLDSEVLDEIEVQIPLYSESDADIYNKFIAEAFPGAGRDEDLEDIYLTFWNKNPCICSIDRTVQPPPRPPKPGKFKEYSAASVTCQ